LETVEIQNPFTVGTQLLGTASYSLFAFVFAYVVFYIIKQIMGVRVSEEEEERGLDISEHGQEAYGS
jgi:Amt family ammonium transporter